MKAIVSVIGTDKRGIIAKVTTALWELNANVEDISQTVMQSYFTMIMLVDLSEATVGFACIKEKLNALGEEIGVEIRIQTEDIFNAMHRI